MIVATNVSRRSFLRTLAYFGGLGFIQPGCALYQPSASSTPDALALKLANFFLHKKSAERVGLEYLRSVPGERNVWVLVDLICWLQPGRRAQLIQADEEEFREMLLLQSRQDFEHDRTVNVRGWILSQTEVRLCALTALV